MRTFVCAICILLVMLSFILIYNHHVIKQITELSHAVSALPEPNEIECTAMIALLEAKWQDMRPHIDLAVNSHTLEDIDHLIASLRITASYESQMTDIASWEHYRSLLLLQLAELKKRMGGGIWQII